MVCCLVFLYFFPVEGASEVHLALPVPELAGPRGAQRARWRPLVPRGSQPHTKRHSRHGTHRRPLQVQTGGAEAIIDMADTHTYTANINNTSFHHFWAFFFDRM